MNKPKQLPDPGEEFANFLDWLLKHHQTRSLKECEIKKSQKKLWSNIDFKEKVNEMGIDNIRIQLQSSHGQTTEVVRIINQNWAKNWANYYKIINKELPRGHHREVKHSKPYKKHK